MSEPVARKWRFYLEDMIAFADKVVAYTDGMDQHGFVGSGLNYDATVRNLELIGEALRTFPMMFVRLIRKFPGGAIIATRNRLIHGYLGIDNDTLWSIIQDDIPALLPELQKLRAAMR